MNLDDVIPDPQYRMCHARNVAAPPTVVWDELLRVTMSALPLARALEGLRLLPARLAGRNRQPLAGRTFLDVTPIPVLFSQRPDVVISAGLSQAWRLLGGSTPPHLEVGALRAWSQPGWIKVAMEFRLESTSVGTLLRTETRMLATDPRVRRAFAAYWFLIRSSSGAIRREVCESSRIVRSPLPGGADPDRLLVQDTLSSQDTRDYAGSSTKPAAKVPATVAAAWPPAASCTLPAPLMEASIKMAEQLAPNRRSFRGVIAEAALHRHTAKPGGPPLPRQHTRPSDRGARFVHRSPAMGAIIDTPDMEAV